MWSVTSLTVLSELIGRGAHDIMECDDAAGCAVKLQLSSEEAARSLLKAVLASGGASAAVYASSLCVGYAYQNAVK